MNEQPPSAPTPVEKVLEQLSMRLLICSKCLNVVGRYSETVLHIDRVHFITPVVCYCTECSAKIRWRPLPQGIDSKK